MKYRWLLLSFGCMMVIFISPIWGKIVWSVMFCLYWYSRYHDKTIYVCLILLFIFTYRSQFNIPKMPTSNIAKVIDLYSNSVLLKIDDTYVIAYNINNVFKKDIIQIQGEYKRVEKEYSFNAFDYATYMARKKCYYQIYVTDFSVVEHKIVPSNYMYHRINQIENPILKSFIKQFLMGIEDDTTLSLHHLLKSSGMYYSVFISFFTRIIQLFFDEKKTRSMRLFFLLFTGVFLQEELVFYRLFIFDCLFFIGDKKDKLGVLILLLLSIQPFYLFHLAFIFPVSFQLFYCFRQDKRFYDSMILSSIIQSVVFYQINWFSILLFKPFRYFLCIAYLCSIGYVLMPNSFLESVLSFYLNIKLPFQDIVWHGKIPIYVIVGILYVLLKSFPYSYLKEFGILCIGLFLIPYHAYLSPFYKMTFLNVGQGDCTIIHQPFSTSVIVIDTGKESSYSKVEAYLHANGVSTISNLFITHLDKDHSGNIEALSKQFNVQNIIYKDKEFPVQHVQYYDLKQTFKTENDNSLLLSYKLNQQEFLFLGDISKEVERKFSNLYPFSLFKVIHLAHHGSNTSTSKELLETYQPKLVIISAGKNSIYNHPSRETLKLLHQYKIPYLNTAEVGDITWYSIKNINFLITSSLDFVIIK